MAYQYDTLHNNQTISGSSLAIGEGTGISNINTSGNQKNKASVSLGSVGDVITGTVIQTGKDPIVEMNGTPIHVRSDVLNTVSKGDQIYLRITGNSSSEITLKMIPQEEMNVTSHNGAIQTEIMKNTANFVEQLKQSQADNNPNYQEFSKEAALLADSITDEEKQQLRQMGIDISSANLAVVKTLVSQMRGEEQETELQKNIESVRHQIRMQNHILPENPNIQVTADEDRPIAAMPEGELADTPVIQADAIQTLAREVKDMLPINDDQMTYMIRNHLSLTTENLYRSGHAGKQRPNDQSFSPETMEQLRPQMERAIQTAGREVNDSTIRAAEYLLKKNLLLNSESINTYLAIQDMNEHGISDEVLKDLSVDYLAEQSASSRAGAEAVVSDSDDGRSPSLDPSMVSDIRMRDMNLFFPAASKVADQIQEDLHAITEDSFFAFANTGMPYTLQNLSAYSVSFSYSAAYQITTESNTVNALTAHRQLEEIRLKMTWEASYSLASEDIHIRAKELTEVVQALKDQERNNLKKQFLADQILPTKEQLHTIEDTNTKMKEIPGLPASALAAAYYSGSFTINRLHEQGIADQNSIMRSVTETNLTIAAKVSSYETLMTAPRKDMGDSIQKAFRNVDSILHDMSLPVTEDNQRAVRILGYNRMEINDSSIAEIKAADQSVQTLIRNLQPSVVLHMVQDGINPLNMPIEELNELSRNYIQEQDLADDGKYSEFLQRLDSRGAITENDRKGYIGIYRLLDKITKSRGKDIGTVVRNGQTLTLQNLLSAHRSNRSTGMELSVSESFGGFDINRQDTSISDAIDQSTYHNRRGSASSQNTETMTAQITYEEQITEQIFDRLTPELIDTMTQEAAEGTTLEEFFDTIKDQITDELPPSDSDTEMSGFEPDSVLPEETLASADLLSQTVTPEDYQFLHNYSIFPSMTNLYMSREIRQASSHLYQDLTANSPDIAASLEQLEDHMTSSAEMEQAYRELEQQKAADTLAKEEDGTLSSIDIQSLKMIRSGLRILQKMSRQSQYEIPFSVDGQWNVIHLSVIEGGEDRGHVRADVHTEQYGMISTDMQWDASVGWQGSYQADSAPGLDFLSRIRSTFDQGLDDIARNHPHNIEDVTDLPDNSELYDISKQLVIMIKHVVRTAA